MGRRLKGGGACLYVSAPALSHFHQPIPALHRWLPLAPKG